MVGYNALSLSADCSLRWKLSIPIFFISSVSLRSFANMVWNA